ncbi:type II toxin-antitoxin system RelE/ParE family toxin [Deinococcus antarcticus]|uniref:Type II toxin-antitoxin system RelE/ParE family toxin n=1 Tax=Deinococcus antarcticus TaxID=1298767 RepID=A0ABV8A5K6_9DEIO
MAWTIILLSEVRAWYDALTESDPDTADSVAAAIDLLEERGPQLGRPLVDTLEGTALPNLKELRPGSTGRSELRILFVFDPERQAVLLMAGNKSGQWKAWYEEHIPLAERRYAAWLAGAYRDEED